MSEDKRIKEMMLAEFARQFGDVDGTQVVFAPGRVNLIGDHTDYNGGHVFPCALEIGTYAVIRKRSDTKIKFFSMNFANDGIIESRVNNIKYVKTDWWANYPKGVVETFKKLGYVFPYGFDMLVYGNLPNSSGLSSSASIEVLTAYSLIKMYGIKASKVKVSKICQRAENEFCGLNCGIMDQFAIAMGKKNHAIYLDTAKLEYEYVPIELDGITLVIANSNKKRGLASSKYNERRSECELALEEIKHSPDCAEIETLGDFDSALFEANVSYIKDPVRQRRARHAVTENERTIKAVEVLNKGDLQAFGRLMTESHISLRDDYEVSCVETDTLVDLALEQKGVLGSRMTGAGFGGCTVSLVENTYVDDFKKNVGAGYTKKTGLEADFYTVNIGGGPRTLR